MSKWSVYVDYTAEAEPRPFYVGMGKTGRVLNFNRNERHTSVKMEFGIRRKVVACELTRDDALKLESELIKSHRTWFQAENASEIASNMTSGRRCVVRNTVVVDDELDDEEDEHPTVTQTTRFYEDDVKYLRKMGYQISTLVRQLIHERVVWMRQMEIYLKPCPHKRDESTRGSRR